MKFSMLENMGISPSISSMLSLYASFSTFLMLFRNAYRELIPKSLESFIISKLSFLFSREVSSPSYATFIIDDSWDGVGRNMLLDASRLYLSAKVSRNNRKIRVAKFRENSSITAALVQGEKIIDVFQGIEITWKLAKREKGEVEEEDNSLDKKYKSSKKGHFEIFFEEKHKEKVFQDYLNHILETYKALTEGEKVLKLFTRSYHSSWTSIDFRHPTTFDSLAMDYELKKSIIDDLDRFLGRKDFYRKIGKAWKRGYLLYGPPGTGKSSLIACMANYLKFDVYDLELGNIHSDADLRRAMLDINRRSITVIEDIDCNSGVQKRSNSSIPHKSDDKPRYAKNFSLSGLLNCIDGLWSSSGEERIIVFTTNRKEVIDPALLRRGRMDMHIHMSYCTTQGFRVLASNYLGIKDHPLFKEIDGLIESVEVTPASVAEELLKSDEAEVALAQVIKLLNRKKNKKEKKEKKEVEVVGDEIEKKSSV